MSRVSLIRSFRLFLLWASILGQLKSILIWSGLFFKSWETSVSLLLGFFLKFQDVLRESCIEILIKLLNIFAKNIKYWY